MTLRLATEADAEAIVRVHFAAVHQTAAKSYPPEILENWSPEPDEERFQQSRRAILSGEEIVIVAEENGGIIGFGCIAPRLNELRAVYVDPGASRRGVGEGILKELERIASSRRLPFLELDASLNAEAFYGRRGYAVISRGTHRLRAGGEMGCVKMRKALDASITS